MGQQYYEFTRYKKIAVASTVCSLLGGVCFEYYRIRKWLNRIVDTNVLDIETKRPDYIYIKYHIYRESMLAMKSAEEEYRNRNWQNVIVHPIGKWWKTIKHSVAWRLLEVARDSADHSNRIKAVRQLALIDHLKDWDYQHLAQICDSRTAISLARHLCDTRWFLLPHANGATRQPKSLIYDLRNCLNLIRNNKCVTNLYGTTLNNFNILKDYVYNPNYISKTNLKQTIPKADAEYLKLCLEIIIHVTTKNPETIRTLICGGILKPLIEIRKLFDDNAEMRFLICKVMANLSMCPDLANHFFVTGWINVLAHWNRCNDLRVQVTAAKVLANLDVDDPNKFIYQPRVYPLYPQSRRHNQKTDLDIVFIHGLLGGVFITWRQKDRENTAELGLYGKNTFYPKESDDVFLVGDINVNSLPSTVIVYDDKMARKSLRIQRIESDAKILQHIIFDETKDTLTYEESQDVEKNPPTLKRQPLRNLFTSGFATKVSKEFIETLTSENDLKSDWEVVFPDCPVESDDMESGGTFSVSGDQWKNDDNEDSYTYCWPMDWLPNDCPNARILGVNYETSISEWTLTNSVNCACEKNKRSLADRAEELLKHLSDSGVGQNKRPIIWVGHSMGGLITKSIIVQSQQHDDEKIRSVADNTRGILFLGTPHKGSAAVKIQQHLSLLLSPTVEVKEMEENGKLLLKLHDEFMENMQRFRKRIKIVSIAEGQPTVTSISAFKYRIHIVPEESAKLPLGNFYVLNVDHLGLSKPFFRQSFLYQRLLTLINDVIVAQSNPDQGVDDPIIESESEAQSNGYLTSVIKYTLQIFSHFRTLTDNIRI